MKRLERFAHTPAIAVPAVLAMSLVLACSSVGKEPRKSAPAQHADADSARFAKTSDTAPPQQNIAHKASSAVGAEIGPTAKNMPARSNPLPPEMGAAIATLYSAKVVYAPPSCSVADLPPDFDPVSALALRRLNEYRIGAGLTPYRYDASLTRLGMAHAEYAGACAKAGKAWRGHFELPSNPGYSREGNEAASTSGLSYGDEDLLQSIEILMAGTFHRLQFLRPEESRVGIGFKKWDGEGTTSIGLFVTRPPDSNARNVSGTGKPRFVLFPPPDSVGIDTLFTGENPDPRPGFDDLAESARSRTGYAASISLLPNDAKRFVGAEISMTDREGHPIDIWVTDPAHPSIRKAPAIYAKGVSNDWAFQGNFGAVFIMPKAPLMAECRYSIHATLHLAAESVNLAWSFTTRPHAVWSVGPLAPEPWRQLSYALAHASPGDSITLGAGDYALKHMTRLSDIRMLGSGPGTRLSLRPFGGVSPLIINGTVVIENLSIACPGTIFYQETGSVFLLRDVSLRGGDGLSCALSAERGTTTLFDRIDAYAYAPSDLCYSMDDGTGPVPRVFAHQISGLGTRGRVMYGPADVHVLDGPLDIPEER
jgi:hypothetical protein